MRIYFLLILEEKITILTANALKNCSSVELFLISSLKKDFPCRTFVFSSTGYSTAILLKNVNGVFLLETSLVFLDGILAHNAEISRNTENITKIRNVSKRLSSHISAPGESTKMLIDRNPNNIPLMLIIPVALLSALSVQNLNLHKLFANMSNRSSMVIDIVIFLIY